MHDLCMCTARCVCYFVIPVTSRVNVSVNRAGIYPQDEHSSCPFCWLFRHLLCTDNSFHSTAYLSFCSQNGCSPGASDIIRKIFSFNWALSRYLLLPLVGPACCFYLTLSYCVGCVTCVRIIWLYDFSFCMISLEELFSFRLL